MTRAQFPAEAGIFLFTTTSRLPLSPPSLLSRALSPWIEQLGFEAVPPFHYVSL